MKSLTVQMLDKALKDGTNYQLIDVRETWEFELGHLMNAHHVPLSTIPDFMETADIDAQYVFICHHGMRSARAAGYAIAQGFENVFNLTGGVAAWSALVDPKFPTY